MKVIYPLREFCNRHRCLDPDKRSFSSECDELIKIFKWTRNIDNSIEYISAESYRVELTEEQYAEFKLRFL